MAHTLKLTHSACKYGLYVAKHVWLKEIWGGNNNKSNFDEWARGEWRVGDSLVIHSYDFQNGIGALRNALASKLKAFGCFAIIFVRALRSPDFSWYFIIAFSEFSN